MNKEQKTNTLETYNAVSSKCERVIAALWYTPDVGGAWSQ